MLLVTTGVIVTVLAFGAAAKPLAENEIGADVVAKYVALAIVPMLQFALPFAAGFAATLVLHRMVTDNEVTAMSAVGMSYRRVLAPVAVLGVALTLLMFLLVAFVVPRFWMRIKEIATADATQVLIAAVNRREALQAGSMLIYADEVELVPAPADTGALRRLLLKGVAAIELAPGPFAPPATEFTAESAAVDVYSTENGPIAKMVLLNATVFRPRDGAIATVPRVEPEAISIEKAFYRGPKFLPLDEVIRLRNDVDRALVVQVVARPLAAILEEHDLWECMAQHAASSATVTLRQVSTRREYRLENARLGSGSVTPARKGAPVRVVEIVNGRPVRATEAESAKLTALSEVGFDPSFGLSVAAPQNTRNLVDNVSARWPPRVDDLVPVGCELRDWASAPSADVLAAAALIPAVDGAGPYRDLSARARRLASALHDRRLHVVFESDSHIVQRFAQSVSIALVLLLGATLAVWLRRALPLTVYLLAFLPAIGNILMIAGGQQVMRNGHALPGALLMWGGNALLLVVLLWAWFRLSRN